MIRVLQSWKDSPDVPEGWRPADPPGSLVKVNVKDREVLRALRKALPGPWVKVYLDGADGSQVHYFQHFSGAVANVKHKRKRR